MKAYMVYSRVCGPSEGAYLVFAHTVQEARAVAWREGGIDLTDEYTDFAATLLRDKDWLMSEANREKLANDVPHMIWDVKSCKQCECWGQSPIGEDRLCDGCRREGAEVE